MNDAHLEWLLGQADRLIAGKQVPVDVDKIVSELGIRVRRVPRRERKAAEVKRLDDDSYEIVLYTPLAAGIIRTPGDRFTMAHEVGHILLDVRTNWNPADKREYFLRERWCHKFAARLLIPEDLVGEHDLRDPKRALRHLLWLAEKCQVPRAVAGWLLADSNENIGFAEFELTMDAKKTRVLRTLWSAPDLPKFGLTRRKMFKEGHPLYAAAWDSDAKGRFREAVLETGLKVTMYASQRRSGAYIAQFSIESAGLRPSSEIDSQ